MAVVNSDKEAEALRSLYLGTKSKVDPIPETPEDGTVLIGFHDRFIEGEYLSVRGK
jgi:hypothetical protein